jgi:hypothetical protein
MLDCCVILLSMPLSSIRNKEKITISADKNPIYPKAVFKTVSEVNGDLKNKSKEKNIKYENNHFAKKLGE